MCGALSGGCAGDGSSAPICAENPIGDSAGDYKVSGVAESGLRPGVAWPEATRRVDVLVVGGGPGGLIAAREIATRDRGLSVLLLERDRAIGAPVRCGEGVGSGGLSEFIDPTGAPWVSRKITKVIFWAPDGTEVRVAEGDVVRVERLTKETLEKGAEVSLTEVLAIGEDDGLHLGSPLVSGAKVTGVVVRETRGPKLLVYKKKRRKGFQRTHGHRQDLVEIRIASITA